jgi:hypothetical protein
VLDGIEDSQTGIRTVAGQKNYLDLGPSLEQVVQTQEFLYQDKGDTFVEHVILAFDLILTVGVYALLLEDTVRLIEIE